MADLTFRIDLSKLDIKALNADNKGRMHDIRKHKFERAQADEKVSAILYAAIQARLGDAAKQDLFCRVPARA